ncbi:MAG: 50S ribosomal protein L22 [Desulfovibrio sp.]|uniref:Large ribosomal subunit protein uL22 n=1 Tax=Megalodesulfovibrio gigas (strain ATCC 19364 / DSM 1382 / NCIMB 9332 / VKM B-1759) TaxID=1121448 RepID=T2GF95_MEGG1|nr:50S ribosomal protein L22 [Megalodesulfovibrio gigas]AGW14557.1 putative 50S ribosomal protein L22 [Megalodesulfovibrio gigas DSM 1382 = ATCC 19364]MCA1946048.1 50S ribosomal protein L22 [Desulfovibrio sp.]
MEVKATAKHMRIGPRKVRLVARNIQGRPVEDALNILKFTPKKAAEMLTKVVSSAVANAEQLPGVDVDSLVVKQIIVDQGSSWKRHLTRSMGRVNKILKRSSHITVIVAEQE